MEKHAYFKQLRAKFLQYKSICRQKISSHTIRGINNYGSTSCIDADFVEFDKSNKNDKALFKEIENDSKHSLSDNDFTNLIAHGFLNFSLNDSKPIHYYGLLLAQSDYNNIDKKNILGLAEVFDGKHNPSSQCINFIQSMPDCRYDNNNRKYAKVRERMLDGIADENKKRYIFIFNK